MSKGVRFALVDEPNKREIKTRASTEWNLHNGQQQYNKLQNRFRSQTRSNKEIINPTISPQRSARDINMKRPLTERSNKTIQKMWIHSTSTSVFNLYDVGMESMLHKLNHGPNGHGHEHECIKHQTGSSLSLCLDDESKNDNCNWDNKIRKWETQGEWIECRESLSSRVMWYNTLSHRLVFDIAPTGVHVISSQTHNTTDDNDNNNDNDNDNDRCDRPIQPYEDEDIVQGLLSFDNHKWDFNNLRVDIYRAQSVKCDYTKFLPKPQSYCFPEYFSLSPLPELPGGKFLAKIRLPEEFSAHRRYSSVQIKVDYTAASDAIKQGVDKLDYPHNTQRKDFILKVVGQEAYMYGRRKIIDYEAVRNAVRNENDVEFVLIKRKDFKQRIEKEKEKQKKYTQQFKSAYPLRIIENIDNLLPVHVYNTNIGDGEDDSTPYPSVVSLYECEWHYRLKIEGVSNVANLPRFDFTTCKSIYVVAELWIGDILFEQATLTTSIRSSSMNASQCRWGEWLSSRNQTFAQIPRESTLCFMVMGVTDNNDTNGRNGTCLAWTRLPLIDEQNKLRSGKYLLNMWEIPVFKLRKDGPKQDPYGGDKIFRYSGITRDKNVKQVDIEEQCQCQLLVEFDTFAFDVIAPKYIPCMNGNNNIINDKLSHHQLSKQEKQLIASVLNKTPLESLDIREKRLIWQSRDLLWHDPCALPAFLRSVNWTCLYNIVEAHKYLDLWAPPKRAEDALEYLSYKFADTRVREKAISWLKDLHDDDLNKILLQLVQCLKYELYHCSALSKFLIRRSLKNPYQIGHFFFWHLKAEYTNLFWTERFGLLMEEYLLHAGQHSAELFIQNIFLKKLKIIAYKIQRAKKMNKESASARGNKNKMTKLFHRELNKLNHDIISYTSNNRYIQMPVNPRWHAKRIMISKCRYMSSKKVPLWLVFENADPYAQNISIMFKCGDDLRQDMLTLQMISVMDRLWLDSKLDLHLKPYNVLATGPSIGMLQIVNDSVTVNTINMQYGGAFNETTIDKYLKKHNQYHQALKKARENFARSCAGYCVATCVLGIGDRHSDNYMVHENGQFFHIDFGHFLGNFKSKFGIKRERSPFVFTPQMRFAIDAGAKKCHLYDEFLNWCAEAYNVLRARSRLLLVLFSLMVSAGLPELSTQSDIAYFKNMLNLRYEVKKATQHVHKQIASALKDKARLMDNHIHLTVHKQ